MTQHANLASTNANFDSAKGTASRSTNLTLIPPEHRLPALLFFVIETVFGAVTFTQGSNQWVRGLTIIAMALVACVFLLRFFPAATKADRPIEVHTRLNLNQIFSEEIEELYKTAESMRDTHAYTEAAKHYHKVVQRQPDHWKAVYNYAYCLMHSGCAGDAKEEFAGLAQSLKALGSVEPGVRLIHASCYNELASILDGERKYKEAYRMLQKALEITPNDPVVHLNLLVTCARLGAGFENEAHGWFKRLRPEDVEDVLKQLPLEELKLLRSFPWFREGANNDRQE